MSERGSSYRSVHKRGFDWANIITWSEIKTGNENLTVSLLWGFLIYFIPLLFAVTRPPNWNTTYIHCINHWQQSTRHGGFIKDIFYDNMASWSGAAGRSCFTMWVALYNCNTKEDWGNEYIFRWREREACVMLKLGRLLGMGAVEFQTAHYEEMSYFTDCFQFMRRAKCKPEFRLLGFVCWMILLPPVVSNVRRSKRWSQGPEAFPVHFKNFSDMMEYNIYL